MRPARFAACAVALCACIPRVAPDPGPARSAVSGVPQAFTGPKDLPPGSEVRWDFGDGQPGAAGPEVRHAFPRAGNFTVTQTVVDRDGEKRSAAVAVTVARRGVPAAVPGDVRAALVLERPWARVKLQRETARRIGLGDLFDETARGVSEALGFDAQDPAAAEQNGVDTDEGFALYTVPQDPEALVVAVGISDAAKAEAALRLLLTRPVRGGPFALREEKGEGGLRVVLGERAGGAEKVAFLERHGYLYLRTPGQSDPLPGLATAARLDAGAGLENDPGFRSAVARVGQGDAIFYSAAPRPGEGETRAGARLAGQIGSSAFAVQVAADQVRLSLFSQLRSLTGQALIEALTPLAPPPDVAGKLPAGAAAFLKLSGDPKACWRELLRMLGPDGAQLPARFKDLLGADVESAVLPAFSGNGGVAIYLDATALIEALLGEQVAALDRSTFLTVSELLPGKDGQLRAALDHATRDTGGGKAVRGATFWQISEGLQVAIRDGFFYAALGGAVAEEVETDEERGGVKSGARPAWMRGAAGPAALDPAAVARRLLAAAVKSGSPAVKPGSRLAAKPAAKGKPRLPPPPPPEPTAAELGPLAVILLAAPGAPTLAGPLGASGLPLDQKQAQLAWIDLHGTLERLERAGAAQGGMVGAAVRLMIDRVRGLRDALVDARPQPDGIAASVTLRLRPDAGKTAEAR